MRKRIPAKGRRRRMRRHGPAQGLPARASRCIPALLLAAALLAPLAGCASIFDTEYLSHAPQTAPAQATDAGGAMEVGSYTALKLALGNLVSAHEQAGVIDFRSYDGDVAADLAAAAREVSDGTALGDYCVDYIHYDLDRIVAYYEAKISVIYKRTAEEVAAIRSVSGASGLYAAVEAAMAAMEPGLTVSVSTTLGAEDVAGYVEEIYLADPARYARRPTARVELYSGGGLQKIFELALDYGDEPEALARMRGELERAVEAVTAQVSAEGAPYEALQLATLLMERCAAGAGAGSSAWDALVAGAADSEGMALAYKALCDARGIDCVVVAGRLDQQLHYWNILSLEGASYHADVSQAAAQGFAACFLVSDLDMWGAYWWDNQGYPSCDGTLRYADLVETEPSPPPGVTPTPGPTETPEPTDAPEPTPSPPPTEAPDPAQPGENT